MIGYTLHLVIRSFLVSALLAAATSENACSLSCHILSERLPGKVVSEQQSDYQSLNNDRWSLTSVLKPACIVLPQDALDVALLLQIIVNSPQEDTGPFCNFSVKSGGHSPFPGFNDINGGISVDLSHINTTSVAPDHSFVSLGSGAIWRDVYASLENTGVIIPGAECSETGVGGVILGGGISYFLPRVGFVADNIINYEVVLASGDIVNANADSHKDLWLALRGGSSNFGIVTRFDVAALPSGPIWGGGLSQPAQADTNDAVLRALHDLARDDDRDRYAAYGGLWSYNTTSGDRRITHTMVHTNGTAHADAFRPFEAIGPHIADSLRYTSIAALTDEASTFMPKGYRDLGATISFSNDLSTLRMIVAAIDEVFEMVSSVPNMTWIFSLEPLPRYVTELSVERGGNVMGLHRNNRDRIIMMIAPRWQDSSYDDIVSAAVKLAVARIQQITKSAHTDDSYQYMNYAGGFQDPIAGYGEASTAFLHATRMHYDPRGIFQHRMPGGFKIPNMGSSPQAGDQVPLM